MGRHGSDPYDYIQYFRFKGRFYELIYEKSNNLSINLHGTNFPGGTKSAPTV